MRTTTKRLLSVFAATALLGTAGAPAAMADTPDEHETTLEAHLTELNDSGVQSTAWLTLNGNELHVSIESSGLLAEAPHAQHIHIGGNNICPDPSMQGAGVDGAIRTTDAAGDYGMVKVSLTTQGDTSADSALAVDRFPVGDAMYERTLTVDDDVAQSLRDGDGSVVLHGVDHNGNGTYDGEQMSDLDPSLPSEATDPAACGALDAGGSQGMPSTGVNNVDAANTGLPSTGSMVAGGALFVAAAAAVVAVRRRSSH